VTSNSADLGEFDLKGVSAPLRAYELQGVGSLRTRLDISRSRGFSKFVGRERDTDHEARRKIAGELLLLDDTFQELLPILFDFMGVADPTRPAADSRVVKDGGKNGNRRNLSPV